MNQATFNPEFFGHLFEAEDRHFWFRARNKVIATVVRQLTTGLAPGYRVLEIGCGTGNTLRVLEEVCQEGVLIGMDLYADGLRYARQRVSCALVQGDVRRLPFGTGFDLICLFDVLEHLPDDTAVLRMLQPLLTPRGRLLLTVPAHMSLWSYFDEVGHHCRRYAPSELRVKLCGAGYQVDYLTQYMAALFPLMWLGRRLAALKNRWTRRAPRPSAELAQGELRIVPGLNAVLGWLLAGEPALVRSRRQLPIGTSLLAVAALAPL